MQYARTRHNLGFIVIEALAQKHRMRLKVSRVCRGLVAEGSIQDRACLLLMPMTYMNHSGVAVRDLVAYYKIPLDGLLVVCDDFTLPFGQCRVRSQGSDGGHNGLASVVSLLDSDAFPRLRMGVGAPPPGRDPVDYVLAGFEKNEREQLDAFVDQGAECCQLWLREDIGKVMSQFNKRKENG